MKAMDTTITSMVMEMTMEMVTEMGSIGTMVIKDLVASGTTYPITETNMAIEEVGLIT